MENPFASLFRGVRQKIKPIYLGVDIGTTSVKIAEVEQGQSLPRISNYLFLESQNSLTRANRVFQTSSLKLFEEEMAELLRVAILRMRPKTDEVVASLPNFSAFVSAINFPKMSDSELRRTLTLQAKQYIPLPVSEVVLDWLQVGEYRDEKGFEYAQVLLIAVPQEHVRRYQAIFKAAGLHLTALEIEGLSLARALSTNDPTPTFVVDIGSRSTAIAVTENGQLKFSAQSDFAGTSLTQALANGLNINPLRAEELKRERGILGVGPNYELSTIMLPFLDAILNEVKRAQFNYETQFPTAKKIERIVLSGGGANLVGIEKYVSDRMGMPTVKASPFTKFEHDPALQPLVSELNPLLSVALGLTLREFA